MNIGNIGGQEYRRETSGLGNTPVAKEQHSIAEPQDKIEFTDSNNGKLKLIVNADTPEAIAQFKEELSNSGDTKINSTIMNSTGSKITADLPLINGIAIEIDQSQLGFITGFGKGVKVWSDDIVSTSLPMKDDNEFSIKTDVSTQILGLDKLHAQGFTGKGRTICIIDTGIAQHPDVKDRIIAFKDFVNGSETAYDDQGHGTHCAGIAAGNGTASEGKYVGSAPEANLVGIKVMDKNGRGPVSNMIKALQWAIENKDSLGIDVVSISIAYPVNESATKDPVALAAEKAVEAGLILCAAAGNSGPKAGTIGMPGNVKNVITVGNMLDNGTIDKSDDLVFGRSSVGPTKFDDLTKPDIVAPGYKITSASHNGSEYVEMTGTSMSTPCVAGIMAIATQVKPGINPIELKDAAMKTAYKLSYSNYDPNRQGAGGIDPKELLLAINPDLNIE